MCVSVLFALISCQGSGVPEGKTAEGEDGKVYHGMIQLGEKLDDPYTVENMKKALESVYSTKSDRVDVVTTDLYVRFLPSGDEQLAKLQSLGLYLLDHPMDYRILREGDYYKDPAVQEDEITWQYAVVPKDFAFPSDIKYEVLDECFISEHDPLAKSAEGIDWDLVEREAFRLTGNGDMLDEMTKAGGIAPSGRITIEDPLFSGGKPFGVAGVEVACNIFVKIATCYTDRDGYYKMEKNFSGKPRYRLVFQNEKGFKIGFNLILLPASVSTLGKGEPEGMDWHVSAADDNALFRRCAVNNAAYDYYTRCNELDLGVATPPADLRFWILNGLDCSSASMLHHGAFLDNALLVKYLGPWLALVKIFLPDVTIGTKEQDYAGIYTRVAHELSHASHYAQAGNSYWSPYVDYVIRSIISEGGDPYGTGEGDGASYCELGESWAYFMEESLKKDRYSGVIRRYGNTFWFRPDIFTDLYGYGMSREEMFRALTSDVTGMQQFKEALVKMYPDRESIISQTFKRYGK